MAPKLRDRNPIPPTDSLGGPNQSGSDSSAAPFESPDEEESPPRKKTTGRKAKTKPAKKASSSKQPRRGRKRKYDDDEIVSDAEQFRPLKVPPLKPVTIPLSDATKNTNKWLEVKDNLSIKKNVSITPIPDIPKKLQLCDVVEGRKHQVVKCYKKTMDRQYGSRKQQRPDPKAEGYIPNLIESWIVVVKDMSKASRPSIILFDTVAGTHRNASWRAGPLETRFCPTEADARRVGEAACVLLDRYPKSLAGWEKVGAIPGKRMVESLAFSALSDSFDYLAVDPIWRGPVGGTGDNYDWPLTTVVSAKKNEIVIITYTADGVQHYNALAPDRIDLAKVEAIGHGAPNWFYYTAKTFKRGKNGDVSDEMFQKLLPLIRYIQYKIWGCVAEDGALNRYFHTLLAPFLKAGREVNNAYFGPCDDRPGWSVLRRGQLSQIRPRDAFVESVEGDLPYINIVSKSKVIVAYVLQQGLNAWMNGEGQLNTWQEMVQAADMVDVMRPQLTSFAKILKEYCCCRSPEMRSRVSHYCMSCWILSRCSNCIKRDDGRTVCQECVLKHGAESPIDFTLAGGLREHIRHLAIIAWQQDAKRSGRPKDRSQLEPIRAKLEEYIVDVALDRWTDAWDAVRSWSDATYSDTMLRSVKRAATTVTHPLIASIEAVNPFCMVNGVLHLHHPNNVVLTSWSLNRLHSSYPIFILPWCRLAIENIEREQAGEQRDLSFWASFRNAMDCAMWIGRLTPLNMAQRLAQKLTTDEYEELKEMWKTGRPSPNAPDPTFSHHEHKHRRESETLKANDIQRLDKLIRDFERKFPKYRLPRSKSGAPWVFPEDQMPENWSWDDVDEYFDAKYSRCKHWCNRENETNESSETILLACIIWFLKTGGIDGVFGCPLTIYSRHPFTLSVGRASDATPGSRMATGFKCLHPSSIDDYDESLCSMTFEGWMTNQWKHNFDLTLVKKDMTASIKEIPMRTVWYDEPAMDLPAVRFPTTFVPRGGMSRAQQGGGSESSSSSDDGDDYDDDGHGGGGEEDDDLGLLNDRIEDEDISSFDASTRPGTGDDGQQATGQGQGQGQGQGDGREQTTVIGATLIDLNTDGFQPENTVPPNHALYGKALSVGDRLGWPTADGRFVDADGLVGMYLQEGDTIHVCAKFAQVIAPPSFDIGLLENYLMEQKHLTIHSGTWMKVFSQHNASGVGLRCLWNAVSFSWSGSEDAGSSEAIRDRVQALLFDVLSSDKNTPANPSHRERAELYHKLRERYPNLLYSLETMEMGELDNVQLIADALDAEIFLYVPRELTREGNRVLVGSWDLLARGQPSPENRQIHLVNYPNARHWTALWPLGGTQDDPPVSVEARVPIPDFPDMGITPIPRLEDFDEGNLDLRHRQRRGSESSRDGHVADMRPFPDVSQAPDLIVRNWPPQRDEQVSDKHPMYGVAVIPFALVTKLGVEENRKKIARPIVKDFQGFVDGNGDCVAEWQKTIDGDYIVTAMDSGKTLARFSWLPDFYGGNYKWRHVQLLDTD